MIPLYICNIAIFVLLPFFVPIYLTRYFKLGWLNVLTIPAFSLLPVTLTTSFTGPFFFLEDGLFNVYFQYALLVSNVHDLIAAVTLILLVRWLHKKPAIQSLFQRFVGAGGRVKPERMQLASQIFLGLFAVSFVLLAQHSFSVLQWIIDPRTGYQLHRTGAGQWYAFAISFLSISVVLATTYARSSHSIIFLAPGYLVLTYLLGSKATIVAVAQYIIIILALRHYKYLNQVMIVILGGAAALIASSFASVFGHVGIDEVSQYSDYFVNGARYYESYLTGQMPLFHGEVFLSSFWEVVPRALYPDKPYVYGLLKVVDVFYPGSSEQTNTPAFTTVDYFADFGWLEVVGLGVFSLSNLLTAVLYALVLPRIKDFGQRSQISHSRTLVYPYLLLVAPLFLLWFQFPANLFVLAMVIVLIEITNRVAVSPEVRAARTTAPT